MRKKRLGDVLKGQGKISEQDLELVIAAQQKKVLRLGELLLERELVSKADIAAALTEVSGMRYVECPPATIVLDVLAVIPPDLALRCHALPVEREGKNLIVAMAEPQNLGFLDELRFASGMEISPRFSFRDDVLAGIKKFYGVEESSQATEEEETGDQKPQLINETDTSGIEFLSANSREKSREALQELQAGMKQRTPAVHMVSKILAAAASKRASDIHFEPNSSGLTVRLRVDGVLCEWGTVPAALQASVISRVKILADLDIAERRVPQDGRFLIQYRSSKFDLRVSTMLTSFGEKAVLRLLDPTATRVSFQQLGISTENADALAEILAQPQGMLLVTGPTGSGKSTTLYAALNLLHVPSRNIVTVEDPVEHMLEGVNQIQVNRKTGLNFANCLRSVLRQDPDIIMVGEIRDRETAEIAMEAAETGHLVLSTLHTNDSISAITRLLDLNVPPYLVASSLTGVIAQRLLRTLCPCRRQVPATPEHIARLLSVGVKETDSTMCQPVGCPACDYTGYKGRVGIFEMLSFEEQIRASIHSGVRPEEIRNIVQGHGFKTIQEEALEKVKEGLTTLEEVRRVVPFVTSKAVRCHACSRQFSAASLYCSFCGTDRRRADSMGQETETTTNRNIVRRTAHDGD